MSIEIREVSISEPALYDAVLEASDHALFYHSTKYRAFLSTLMPDCGSRYLVAVEEGRPVAVLPSFSRQGPFGLVVNSLPFYGSHGGIVSVPGASARARSELLAAFHHANAEQGAIWATMVANPFFADPDEATPGPRFTDERIGQFTPLPAPAHEEAVKDALLAQCHQKTRNMIRKGQKSGYTLGHGYSKERMTALFEMHVENMRAIGGLAKDRTVFDAIDSVFTYDDDYRIYHAIADDGSIASLLLIFYYKGFVEYFVPCSDHAHRSNQPLSALIYQAMVDAVIEKGALWWNWGGTWVSQDGVYRFKARWGTQDFPYRYAIWSYEGAPDPKTITREALAGAYPFFYTLPYGALAS